MPKTAKNLWDSLVTWDNLLLAAQGASRSKGCRAEVLRFNAHLEENLLDLQRRLVSGQWYPGHYRKFEVYEPKMRLVHAPPFIDRVLHHVLVQIIGPYFERKFINHSFACRKGRGTHAASNFLGRLLRSAHDIYSSVYVLKADISKYFYSIDHEILLKIVARIIGDERVLEIIRRLILNCGCIEGSRGLPLGALTSQLFANAYLDQLDHFVKEKLQVRHYVRYMDDFVLLHEDKSELWRLLGRIGDFLNTELHLVLNHKTRVFPASHGIDFAGYRHWTNYKLPRKRNVKKAKLRFKKISSRYAKGKSSFEEARSVVASFVGYMRHCKGWRSSGSVLERLVLRRDDSELN